MADQNIKIAISAVDQTKAAFSSINKSLLGLQSSLSSLGIAVSMAAFGQFIKSQIDFADKVGKTSQKIGIATEDLSKLAYAAKLSDVDFEALQGSMIKFNKNIVDAQRGTGDAREAFEAMGISITNSDGSLKSNTQLLGEISDKFATYEDGANKTALANAYFGKTGANLIPLLNQGSQGLKDAGDQLERYGGLISGDFSKNAEVFNDNLTRLNTQLSAIGKSLGSVVLPYLNDFLSTIIALNEVSTNQERSWWEVIIDGATPFSGAINTYVRNINKFNEAKDKLLEDLNKPKKPEGKDTAPALANKALENGRLALADLIAKTNEQLQIMSRTAQMQLMTSGMTDEQKAAIESLVKIYDVQIEKEREINKLLKEKKITQQDADKALLDLAISTDEARKRTEELLIKQEELNGSWQYGAQVALQEYANQAANVNKAMQSVVSGGLKSMEDALLGIMMRTSSVSEAFRSMANSIIADLARMAIRQMITAPIAQALGLGISGARASGGTVTGGNAYLVGEQGAEVFVPNKTGTIVPNDQMGGSGTVVNQTINISTGVAQTVRTEIQSMMPRIMDATKAAVADAKRRGGTFGKMMA